MNKDFDGWNNKKKIIDLKKYDIFFKEGEVWWVNLGLNIGFETNGKNDEYTRPVLIIKKYNQYSFLALPLTTSKRINIYRMFIGTIDNKESSINLSQIRNIDSKRLVRKVCTINKTLLVRIKEKTIEVNFQ